MATTFEDLRQSDNWAEYIRRLGWRVEELGKAKIFIRKLPLVGSVGKIQRPSVVPAVGEIDEIAKEHRVLFVKLEPGLGQRQAPPASASSAGERRAGLQLPQHQTRKASVRGRQTVGKHFEPDNWPLTPTRTIHIDLAPSEEEIFRSFSKDARYSVRKALQSGVSVCHSEGASAIEESLSLSEESDIRQRFFANAQNDDRIKTFYNLLEETGKRKRFWVAPFKDLRAKAEAFKNKSALIFAYHNHEPIAGALILFHDKVAYYHHAASNLEGRKLLAPYLVVWEAIKLAKERSCHTLDLEGIYDPRYKIYRRFRKIGIFKKKFGGREVEYPGSFVRYYNPIVKLIFKVSSWWDRMS